MTIGRDHFDPTDLALLDAARAEDLALCRKLLATPKWRWLRRATLRAQRRDSAALVGFLYREASQNARDRLLIETASRS